MTTPDPGEARAPAPAAPAPVGAGAAHPRRLVVLMGARLGLALLSLGLALALDAAELGFPVAGLYYTVALAFLATIASGLLLRRVRRTELFAAFNIAADFGIVTSLVHFSGGTDSVFSFLYVIVAVYGAPLFRGPGALASAALGALAYGSLLLSGSYGWIEPNPGGMPEPAPVLFTLWAVHAGALGVAALLGRFLAAELQRTGEALDRSTSDLHQLRSLHRRIVESLMSGLLTSDGEGRITSFNPEAERITGLSLEQVQGRPVAEVLPEAQALLLQCGEDGSSLRPRMRSPYRNARGEELHLGLGAYVLRDGPYSSGHVVIFQDVTDVVQMERELRLSERLAAVGGLSASIAHEIRNPLAAISGSIQVLQRLPQAEETRDEPRRLMDIVLRETDRLDRLVTDFLHYARPGPLRRERLRVADVVGELLTVFEASRPADVRISVEVPAALELSADGAQLRQVLWNLLLNAAQAMPEGGALRIHARPDPAGAPQESSPEGRREVAEKSGWIEIAVADEGAGIAADVLEHIFDPFFSTKRDGSGLGLATVHRIVEGHGGSVRLESAPGQGTTVRLRFPSQEVPA